MSTFVKREAPKGKGPKLPWILGLGWLLVLAVIWIAFRGSEGESGGFLNFIGRFHVIIVHLPIGVIFLAFAMDILSRLTTFSHLRNSLPFVLWIAFLSAIAATVAGYLLMSAEGYGGRAVDLHMYFGLAVVVCSLLALVLTLKSKTGLGTLAMAAAAFTTMASGHFGGAMIHDADYLTEHAPESLVPILQLGIQTNGDTEIIEAEVAESEEVTEIPLGERIVYTDFIVPILEGTCNECHNENKIKGKLRMDTHELLLAGAEGSDFPTVVPGNAEESEMIVRVMLEPDDDEFMPPKGDGLTPDEIKMLSLWIAAGAKTETTIAELGEDPTIEATALAVEALHAESDEADAASLATLQSIWDTLSPEEQQQRMEDVTAASEKYHFSIMPISAEDDRLRVNVINAAKEFGDEQLALLEPVADRILWLDLARSQVSDEGLKVVGKMGALERLHLENTQITDAAGIAALGSLQNLEYLNLYGTKVGNGAFESFEKMPKLRKIYVWQTGIDPSEARTYERKVNLEINTGVELAVATAPAPEEAAAAPAEKPAEKKPEPKPTAKPAPKEEAKPKAPDTPAKPAAKAKGKAKEDPKPAPKPAVKPAEAPKETPKPAATAPAKPAAPKAKVDTPPAPKPEAKPAETPASKPAPKAQ